MNRQEYLEKKEQALSTNLRYNYFGDQFITNEQVSKAIISILVQQENTAEKDFINLIKEKSYLAANDQSKKPTITNYENGGTSKDYHNTIHNYQEKIKNRTMTQAEYEKIMKEISEHNSILPLQRNRGYSYGHGSGDVILSSTTNTMYCVENREDREKLLEDYQGYQYYSSRSGSSGSGRIIAGKRSLIYLPTCRHDVAHPEKNYVTHPVNNVQIFARSNRGIVDKDYPITIVGDDNSDYDFAFLNPHNVPKIIEAITTQGESLESLNQYEHYVGYYYDENLQRQKLYVDYLADKKLDYTILNNILRNEAYYSKYITQTEHTGSMFDTKLGIRKIGNSYALKGKHGFVRKIFGAENPRFDQLLMEYVIGDAGSITKEYYGNKEAINGRVVYDAGNIATKETPDGTKVLYEGKISELDNRFAAISNHWINYSDDKYDSSISGGLYIDGETYTLSFETNEDNYNQEVIKHKEQAYQQAINQYLSAIQSEFTEYTSKKQDTLGTNWEQYQNLHYQIVGDKVFIGYAIKNKDLHARFEKLGAENYQDYEQIISIDDWKDINLDELNNLMKSKAYEKAKQSYINKLKRSAEQQIIAVKQLLIQNPDKLYIPQDSFDSGNCEPGTEGFMSRFNIPKLGITGKELTKHPEFNRMLQEERFRNIFLRKVEIEGIEELSEIEGIEESRKELIELLNKGELERVGGKRRRVRIIEQNEESV